MTTPPMRTYLSIYLARDAAKAVILRRGPSKWTRMILWHVDTDEFEMGQWFKGKIYDADLSLDGRVFAYTAGKRYQEAWTALSKPPYFTAFALLALGDTFAGSIIFKGNRQI